MPSVPLIPIGARSVLPLGIKEGVTGMRNILSLVFLVCVVACVAPDASDEDSDSANDKNVTAESDQALITPRGVCGNVFNPSVSGGKAHWTLACSGGNITMAGWVEDTAADGKCAQVKGVFNNNIVDFSQRACPKGVRRNFSFTHPGTIVDGFLMVIP